MHHKFDPNKAPIHHSTPASFNHYLKVRTFQIKQDASRGTFTSSRKAIMKKFGQAEANWLAEVISWYQHLVKQGKLGIANEWFYYNKVDIEEKIGISLKVQTRIIEKLKKDGVLEVDRKGLPARNYYRINWDRYKEIIAENEPIKQPKKRKN